MKKTIALLLGLMLILGFALVACGDEATTDDATDDAVEETTDDTTTDDSVMEEESDAIDWTEAADYEEQEATVTGTIDAINDVWTEKQIPKILLVMGDPEGDHFNIVVKLNADGTVAPEAGYDLAGLNALLGKTVEITGTVKINAFESVYEIFLTDNDDASLVVGELVVK